MMPNDEMDAPLAPLVLVVEDDPDVRCIAADIFHEAELKTAEASTAEEALASYAARSRRRRAAPKWA